MMRRSPLIVFGIAALVSAPLLSETKAEAEAMVKKAVAYAKANSKDKLLAETNASNPTFLKGELYLVILDGEGVVIAHGKNSKFVGKNMAAVKDPDGVLFTVETIKIGNEKGKGWVNYKFTDPTTKTIRPKTLYIEKFENIYVCCGIYSKK